MGLSVRWKKKKFLNLSVDVAEYKIFVNENNDVDKIENLSYANFSTDSEEIAQLLEIAQLEPIKLDFKSKILCKSFQSELKKYTNKFKPKKLDEICRNEIDYKLVDYYERNKKQNLLIEPHTNFLNSFFKLNSIIKSSPYLKQYFPRLIRNRGTIAISFLEFTTENDMEEFIDDIRKMVSFELAEWCIYPKFSIKKYF